MHEGLLILSKKSDEANLATGRKKNLRTVLFSNWTAKKLFA